MADKEPAANPWAVWTGRLSPTTARALCDGFGKETISSPVDDYAQWQSGLSQTSQAHLSTMPSGPMDTPVEEEILRWCCVEVFSGEYPICRAFRSPEALAVYVGSLEGQDVAVWCFYGRPMQFTVGPQRYLLLPDAMTAIQIPLYDKGPCNRVSANLLDGIDWQEEGFLGPAALLETPSLSPVCEEKEEEEDDEEETAIS